jgi:hypothetical protein
MQSLIANRAPMKKQSRASAVGGSVLILLTALLVAVTPWTEYFWHFDNFLRGGQDLELSLLSIVTVFSLVLVLSHVGEQRLRSIVAICRFLSSGLEHDDISAFDRLCGSNLSLDATPLRSSRLAEYNPPLQI